MIEEYSEYDDTPCPPQVKLDTVACAMPYVVPALTRAIGAMVIALALGVWLVQKFRL